MNLAELSELIGYPVTLQSRTTGYTFNVFTPTSIIVAHGPTFLSAIFNLSSKLERIKSNIISTKDLRKQIDAYVIQCEHLELKIADLENRQLLPDDILTFFKNGPGEYLFYNATIRRFLRHFNSPRWMIVQNCGGKLVLTNGTINLSVECGVNKYFVTEVK